MKPGALSLSFKMGLWSFLFGLLMQGAKLKDIMFEGKITINWSIIPAVIISVMGLIPFLTWSSWLGVPAIHQTISLMPVSFSQFQEYLTLIIITPLRAPLAHCLISALGGSLLVSSFHKNKSH